MSAKPFDRKVLLLICFLLGHSALTFAQIETSSIDSIKFFLKNDYSDTCVVRRLNSAACKMLNNGDYKKSLVVSEEIKRIATKINYPIGIGYALKNSGDAYLNMSEYEKALVCLKQAQTIFKNHHLHADLAYTLIATGKTYSHLSKYEMALKEYDLVLDLLIRWPDDQVHAIVLNNIGNIYFCKGSYERSLEYYLKSLKTSENLTKGRKFIAPLNNIGVVHAKLLRHKEALHYFLSYLKEMESTGSRRNKADVFLNIGEIYSKVGDYHKAMQYLDSAVHIQWELNDRRGLSLSYSNLAFAHLHLRQLKQAHRLYNESISLARAIGEDEVLLNPLLGLSNLYILDKEFEKAEKIASEMRAIAWSIKSKLWQEQAFLLASKIDSAKGNYTGAYFWLKRFLPLHDSLFNDQNTRHVIQMREQYQAEKKEKEIQLLNEAKKYGELKQASQWNLFLITVAFSVVVIASLFYWGRVKARNSRISEIQKEKIATSNSELRFLIEKVEQQNKTLSELHLEKDALIGIVAHDLRSPLNRIKGLTSVMSLQANLTTDQNLLVHYIQKVCEDGNNLIRDLLEINEYESSLDKTEFIEVNVSQVVQKMIKDFTPVAKNKGLTIWYEVDKVCSSIIWADSNYLSRILDNLLSNAIKFSPQQSNIYLRVVRDKDEVKIIIRDEGPGFNKEDLPHLFKKFKKLSARPTGGEHSTGLGLSIVKILMEQLGGRVEIETTYGKGATFILTFKAAATSVKLVEKELA